MPGIHQGEPSAAAPSASTPASTPDRPAPPPPLPPPPRPSPPSTTSLPHTPSPPEPSSQRVGRPTHRRPRPVRAQPITAGTTDPAAITPASPSGSGRFEASDASSEESLAPRAATPAVTIDPTTLVLVPGGYESLFWRSPAIQRAARVSDKCAAFVLVVTNCLYLRWQVDLRGASVITIWCFVLLAFNIAHICCMVAAPATYLRYRSSILLASRLVRLSHAATLVCITRASYQTHLEPLAATLLRSSDPATQMGAWRLAVHVTGASLALFYAAVLPLPFLLQLPVQLAYLALMLCFQHPMSLKLMQLLAAEQAAEAICCSLNWVLDTMALAYLGAGPGTHRMNQQCEQHGTEMLLLFVVLYFGVVVPVWVAYRIEYQQKRAYVEQLRRQPRRRARPMQRGLECKLRRGSLVGAVLFQLLLLFLMAMQCWVLVLKGTPYLHWVVVPAP